MLSLISDFFIYFSVYVRDMFLIFKNIVRKIENRRKTERKIRGKNREIFEKSK